MGSLFEIRCSCGRALRVQADMLGRAGTCPGCGKKVVLWSDEVAKAAADRHWYVELDGAKRGPVTFVELRRLASEGRVTPATRVCEGRHGEWIAARDARGDVEVAVPAGAPSRPAGRPPPAPGAGGAHARGGVPRHVVQLGVAGVVVGLLVALFLLTPLGVGGDAARGTLTSAEIAGRTLPSVAIVRGKRQSGSGFMVKPGILLTSYHVIEGELLSNVVVEFPNAEGGSRRLSPTLRFADPYVDLAFLAVPVGVTPLSLAPSHAFVPGQEILVVGSPGIGGGATTLRNAVARGLLSTLTSVDDQPYYQLDIAVNSGNSGGPVLDERGQVIGMVKAKAAAGDHLAFAVPLRQLLTGLERLSMVTESDARRSNAVHRLRVAEQAVLAAARVYWISLLSYVRSIDPRFQEDAEPDDTPAGLPGPMGSFLEEVDREALADVRLLQEAIRDDPSLPFTQRQRFRLLWTTYADLKGVVDDPQGSFDEYTAQCKALGARLSSLAQEIEHDTGR